MNFLSKLLCQHKYVVHAEYHRLSKFQPDWVIGRIVIQRCEKCGKMIKNDFH